MTKLMTIAVFLCLCSQAFAANAITMSWWDSLYIYGDTTKILYDLIDTTTAKIPTATTADALALLGWGLTTDNDSTKVDPTDFDESSDFTSLLTDETGTGVMVFGTSPTFTTDITTPLVIGGTTTTSDLNLKTTSGVGEAGADMHFLVGSDGAIEAMTILNNSNVGIGTTSPYSGLHYQGDILYLTPAAGAESNDDITIKNYANSTGAPNIILRTADIDGAYGVSVGALSLIGGSKTTHYGGIGGGGGKISLQGGQGRDAGNNPSNYAPVLLQSNGGNVGIGTLDPSAPFEVKGVNPGVVGGFQAGMLHVTGNGTAEFSNSVITGHSAYNGNTQLWYFGSGSSSNNDIMLINRQDGSLFFSTNNTNRMCIKNNGYVGIGDISPAALFTVGDGDDFQVSSTGYVSTTGTVTSTGFIIGSADVNEAELEVIDGATLTTTELNYVDGVTSDIQTQLDSKDNDPRYLFTIYNPNSFWIADSVIVSVDPRSAAAITVTRIDATCLTDPDTELDFDLMFADALIGQANKIVIDDISTTSGTTTITSGFDDATIPANKCVYIRFNAEPDADITQVSVRVTYTID